MPKAVATWATLLPILPRPKQAQRAAVQVLADGGLPRAALAQGPVLSRHLPGQPQNEGPGQLDGRG
jgi:hypothetical protein